MPSPIITEAEETEEEPEISQIGRNIQNVDLLKNKRPADFPTNLPFHFA